MRDVGIKRSDVKRDKYGIVGKCVDCVQVGKFVKEISLTLKTLLISLTNLPT